MSQWNIIICIIFVNVVVLVQSSNATPECDHIRVSNLMYWSEMDGIYEQMSINYDCAGHSAYKQLGSSHYMYYHSTGHWVIGSTSCGHIVGIKSNTTAVSPDKVTSTWEEYDGDRWVETPYLDVSCYNSSACGQVRVSNSRYQSVKEGIYEKLSNNFGCAGRPAYSQSGSSNYLFYSSGHWAIGSTKCGLSAGIKAVSTALSPDKVTTTWEVVYDDTWVATPSLDVSCYHAPFSQTGSSGFKIYAGLGFVVVVAAMANIALGA